MIEHKAVTGLSLAFTFFIASLVLYLTPEYFGYWTNFVAGIFIVVGFMGLGSEVGNLAREKQVVNNLAFGAALTILWITLCNYFPLVWLNILITPILLLGIHGMTTGAVNIFFKIVEQQGQPKSTLAVSGVLTIIAGIIGFIASVIQILQFVGGA